MDIYDFMNITGIVGNITLMALMVFGVISPIRVFMGLVMISVVLILSELTLFEIEKREEL